MGFNARGLSAALPRLKRTEGSWRRRLRLRSGGADDGHENHHCRAVMPAVAEYLHPARTVGGCSVMDLN